MHVYAVGIRTWHMRVFVSHGRKGAVDRGKRFLEKLQYFTGGQGDGSVVP